MNILVVGGGGREHALIAALAAAPSRPTIVCAPGNPGIAEIATCKPIAADDIDALSDLARSMGADLVVIGPEAPLMLGLADRLRAAGIPVCGPDAAAARLEGSKAFTKDFCDRHAIPTAAYATFTDPHAARAHIRDRHARSGGAPIVVKADGLAAGKGVVVAATEAEALAAVDAAMVDGAFGDAGATVVIEEFMTGREVSVFALCDGNDAIMLATAHDYKRVGDGDTGANTGGMGSVSPTPRLTPALEERVMAEVIRPTVAGMKADGAPFVGVLYAGLMLTPEGPKLVEYNVRFGDPECQVLMPRLQSDAATLLRAAATGSLGTVRPEWRREAAVCVVMASRGYPGAYARGTRIAGLDAATAMPGVTIFHAGTATAPDGALIAAGGRVLGITALGDSVAAARDRAYAAVSAIDWPEGFYRTDIAQPDDPPPG
ncbi:phosphoribosylamine--glycine ligase [Fodinicurvata sp. EGI_FJ10296]|uniref:phosphoribosylamine--glycine ligase n=1 Tax=Fodinicurvata sp. EGI_FJ10296 TaxID=3231908 RepID=UPI003451A082